MKTIKHSLMLVLLVVSVLATGAKASGKQIEITEIKNLGASALKETHSIIQVSWTAAGSPELTHISFELSLEVTYADGFVEKSQSRAAGTARTNRFEVPTLHRSGSLPAAEIKSFKVVITATYSETTTRQVTQ